jgi:hypothetical protein
VAKSRSHTVSDPVLRKLIPADPIEQAVLGLLRLLLSRKTDLQRDVRAATERVARRDTTSGPRIEELIRERDAIRRKIAFAIETLDEAGMDAAAETVTRLQKRARALEAEIQKQSSGHAVPINTDETVHRVTRILGELSEHLNDLPPAELHRVVSLFVSRAVVDLESRQVDLEICLPAWALSLQEPLCLDAGLPWKPCIETHDPDDAVLLAPPLIWMKNSRAYGVVDSGIAA